MLKYTLEYNAELNDVVIYTPYRGKSILADPWLNKGIGFTRQEREDLGLLGKLPDVVETLEEQVKRAYAQFSRFQTGMERHIFLNTIHEINQTLFYKLVRTHFDEMLPLIYTPVISEVVKQYSLEFRRPRGLYVNYRDIDKIDDILENRTHPDIRLMVVTDGEGVLGIGDQGVGGMCIPIAKLMVYSLCGGIDPVNTLPVMLDVGTDNETLLNDPLYIGERHPRIRGEQYDLFIEKFVTAVKKKFPHVFLHWEDLGRENARRVLNTYQDQLCTFNDDMQGTGCVATAAVLSAATRSGMPFHEQRILVFGAGTAGVGIADHLLLAMKNNGISTKEALSHFWLVDKEGLLFADTQGLADFQRPFARDPKERHAGQELSTLLDIVRTVKPTVLIGCSAVAGAFNEAVVKGMASYCEHPIILPLSNPPERAEAYPADLLRWTDGRALVASGSPFAPVTVAGSTRVISQCNNALAFPGIGLGVLASGASRVTEEMLSAAMRGLSEMGQTFSDDHAILPLLKHSRQVASHVALRVAEMAQEQGLSRASCEKIPEVWVKEYIWEPLYRRIVYRE